MIKAHAMPDSSFTLFNETSIRGAVVVSVPHAGRAYGDMVRLLRVPVATTLPLEDRYADRLVDRAIAAGVPTIIAHAPRLAVDLNRAPEDLDPVMIAGRSGMGTPLTARARGGLGLIPARLAGTGPLWRAPIEESDFTRRMATIHTPYHAAIDAMMQAARRRLGTALLLDIHSMPRSEAADAPDIVIGDRFGRTAGTHLTDAVVACLTGHGLRVACNAPYAGGYIIERHGKPVAGTHALQVEIARPLYLDAAGDMPGNGLPTMQRVVSALVVAMCAELQGTHAIAAE